MASRRRDYGELSERLLKLSIDTNVPEPYPVTDKIIVEPPTKKRGEEMRDAHTKILVSQTLLNALLTKIDNRPTPPVVPDELPEDATEEMRAEHAAVEAAYEEAAAGYEVALANWEEECKAAETQSEELATTIKDATDQYHRAFFGDTHDALMAFFDDKPQKLWDAFVDDIKSEFLGIVHAPADGTCPTCGQVADAEEAGKALSSST